MKILATITRADPTEPPLLYVAPVNKRQVKIVNRWLWRMNYIGQRGYVIRGIHNPELDALKKRKA